MTFYFFSLILFSLHLYATTAAQKSNHQFLGCFLETELLTLGEESRTLTPISPQACSTFCSGKKYLFFILKNENCYCSKNYVSKLMKQLDNECTIKCTGDESASCGGKNLVSSYITDSSITKNFIGHGSFPIAIYLGCYAETPNDDENRILKGPAAPYNNNTPQRCLEICFKMGFLYFGTTYGRECWCGNQKPLKSSKVEDINCDVPCSGDNNQLCGGGWKMAMYSTGITDYTAKNYVGCYDSNDNDEHKTNEKRIIFEMSTNNSPKRCMNLCNTQRFKYAAVKDNVCECMNSQPRLSLKRSQSDCHIVCTENPSEYCGGRNAYSIFKTVFSDPLGKVNVNRIGCFRNIKRHPIVNGWGIMSSNLTPNYCVHNCYARRFPYAALISSRECLCSFTKPSEEGKTEDNMCDIACSGSSQHTCGGQNAIDIYNTGLEWQTHTVGNYYLGCYEESQNKRIFHGFSRAYDVNTPDFCSNLCYKFGYFYSGVTYKYECFCGDQPPSQPRFSKVDDKQCNTKCVGDANQMCGGGWRMSVFSTGLIDFASEDRFIGCFVQEDIPLNYRKFELINTNVPGKCLTICHNDGYRIAGVMGINCFCSNEEPNNDKKVDTTNCDAACVGDSSKTCGGEDRIQLYDLTKNIEPITISPEKLPNLDDTFEELNLNSTWSHDVFIAQEPDYEFVVYNSSEQNSFVDNGELVIKPTVQSDSFIKNGELSLNGCTKLIGSNSCTMSAVSFSILPPVISARLTTRNNFLFHFGHVEVIAKLPIGDWIISEIALVSASNELNRLVLAKSVGNIDLKCNGSNEGASVLKYGLEIDELYHIESKVMKLISENGWHNDYHTFKLSWSSDNNMVFEIDDKVHHMVTTDLPINNIFESEFFLSIGVSVGGMRNFNNECSSNGHLKPWTNFDNKAMLSFWKDRNYWYPTWSEDKSALRVKQVKITLSES